MICTSRRGLSTIVTSAILLTSVAVIGTALVGWSNNNLKVFETSLANTISTNTNQINENLNIENLAFCINCGIATSKNVINVTLTNTGTVSVNVTKIQVNGTAINSYYYSTSSPYSSSVCIHLNGISHTGLSTGPSTCLPTMIMPQQSYTVSANLTSPKHWASQKPDTVTVTTARGSVFATQGAPP
jgi:archaellum component FlaF (FlaF/FlaG flagellin family)